MRLLDKNHNEIQESEIDLNKGRLYTTMIIKPDASPVDDVTKFAYYDDDYEKVQIYERIPDEIFTQRRIDELKHNLSETDYVVIKISEGAATNEDYAEVIASRAAWRKEINELESK